MLLVGIPVKILETGCLGVQPFRGAISKPKPMNSYFSEEPYVSGRNINFFNVVYLVVGILFVLRLRVNDKRAVLGYCIILYCTQPITGWLGIYIGYYNKSPNLIH
jgi:hypothetical protein